VLSELWKQFIKQWREALLDNLTIKAVEKTFHKGLPVDAGAILITDVDGNLEDDLDFQLALIEKIFKQNGCLEFKIAQTKEQAADIWFARRNASQSLSVYGSKKVNEDITVPRSALPQLSDAKQVEIAYKAIKEVFEVTIELGGTLSGEHGIGLSKAPYMNMAFTQEEINLFKSIKGAFDPNNILNPHKMGL